MGCGGSKKSNKAATEPKKVEPAGSSVNPGTFLQRHMGGLSENYKEIRKIGSGAFADVKLCIFKPTNQERAVKVIHKAGLSTQQMDSTYMLKEIQVLSSLDHPNILRCYEIFEDPWKFYVSTEYCAGGELFDKIVALKKFSEQDASRIMQQILSAVSYCHEKKVIHRDLKPENVLLEDSEGTLNVKIADFGSSCMLDKNRKLNGCFGSAYYVSPEVLTGSYNEKCDEWSCGIIMFILLTGRPPYQGRDQTFILKQVRDNPIRITPERCPGISSDAINLLQRLLEVDPNTRITAKDAGNHPWIQNFRSNENNHLGSALNDLKQFQSSSKLKTAVHIFLATQLISHEETKKLKESFTVLDKNGDGKVSRAELHAEYRKFMSEDEAQQTVEKIMKEVDTDGSGNIDYSEFLKACSDYNKLVSRENLEAAFKMFDKDGSGDITIDELKEVLGKELIVADSYWNQVIAEVDVNGDGVIDVKEFVNLMTKN
ncbi:unnamed protein product [Blepharisma stoltei]|uniref:non-specific serine/threonine protein kinase n=1 Tax=Blepharisma stoltei TaxID=1481888 RepID=A0AAU9IYT9_9CILI|nr:unnamed protein product [Blepharisma stoltei]